MRISEGFEHNFLMYIAIHIPKSYTTDAPIDSSLADENEALKEKIKLRGNKRDVLLIESDGGEGVIYSKTTFNEVKYL